MVDEDVGEGGGLEITVLVLSGISTVIDGSVGKGEESGVTVLVLLPTSSR